MPALFSELPRNPVRVAPGAVHVPGFLSLTKQRRLVERCRDLARLQPMRQPQLVSGKMSVYMTPIGYGWDRGLNDYRPSPVPVPHWVGALADEALQAAAPLDEALAAWLGNFRAEMALVNYYPPHASLGMHQDAGEDSGAPIISFSVGDCALFRLGNTQTRGRPWQQFQLLSGDLLVFGGESRMAYHGVPKLLPDTLPAGCGLERGRLNLTIRQVRL